MLYWPISFTSYILCTRISSFPITPSPPPPIHRYQRQNAAPAVLIRTVQSKTGRRHAGPMVLILQVMQLCGGRRIVRRHGPVGVMHHHGRRDAPNPGLLDRDNGADHRDSDAARTDGPARRRRHRSRTCRTNVAARRLPRAAAAACYRGRHVGRRRRKAVGRRRRCTVYGGRARNGPGTRAGE